MKHTEEFVAEVENSEIINVTLYVKKHAYDLDPYYYLTHEYSVSRLGHGGLLRWTTFTDPTIRVVTGKQRVVRHRRYTKNLDPVPKTWLGRIFYRAIKHDRIETTLELSMETVSRLTGGNRWRRMI